MTVYERITDQTDINESFIEESIAADREVVLQYSKPVYTSALLRQLDGLALKFGDSLQIRFFGHYGRTFDCSVLSQLPSVTNLAVDCLNKYKFKSLEVLYELKHLRMLSVETYGGLPATFLGHQAFAGLRQLLLGETGTPKLDLSPIENMRALRHLHITGYSNGIGVLGELPALEYLSLSQIKNKVRLDFVSRIKELRSLRLLLGGRADIAEIVHPNLSSLHIIRVRGFCRFAPNAFSALRELQIEDQIKLLSLDFIDSESPLEELKILNCKNLSRLSGLRLLRRLWHMRISKTAIEFDALVSLGLPDKLRVVGFYTGNASTNRVIQEKLAKLGYSEHNLRS